MKNVPSLMPEGDYSYTVLAPKGIKFQHRIE